MQKPRRRSLVALATVLVATTLVTAIPVSTASAAPVFYNGAGSAPRISVIGDSTIAVLRWINEYGALERFNFTYDAESCRRTIIPSCRGREGYTPDTTLNAMRRLSGQLGSVLVIMGGYDDPSYGFGNAVDAVMAEAMRQGIPTVMWLTLRSNVSYVGPGGISYSGTFRAINQTLLQKARQYGPRLQIADWAAYSANHPEWFAADGIHFGSSGATVIASYIASQAARVLAGQVITPPAGLGSPSAPQSLTAWVYPDRVTLTWSAPSTNGGRPITAYLVQRSTDGGRTWVNVAGVPYPSRIYTVTGLTTGTTYHFRVAAKNDLGWSPHSNVVSGTPQLMVPWPPWSLTAEAYSDRVTLTWIVPSMDGGRPITAYLVQRSVDGGRTWVNVAGVPYPNRIYTVTGLTTGTTYHFRVAAMNTIGWSRVSNVATATPTLTVPWPPRSLTAVPGNRQVALRWSVPAYNGGRPITAYLVQRSTDGGRTWVNVAGVAYPSRLYTVAGLTNGTAYSFRVAALNALGWSRVSDSVAATPRAAVATALLAEAPTATTTTAVPTTTTTTTTTTTATTTTTTTTTSPAATSTNVPSTDDDHSDADTVPATSAEPAGSTIGDFVWLDGNGDGLQDPDEAGVEGIDVVLLDASGVELARDRTDHLGRYEFAEVLDGSYALELELPAEYGITLPDQGLDDEIDSDLLTTDGQRGTARTDVFVLPAERANGFDLGLVAAPVVEQTTTTSPEIETTEVPTTTEVPIITAAPTTVASTTTSSTTEPPPTQPPTTEATTTAAPTTLAPTTVASATTVIAPTTTAAVGG